MLEGRRRCCSWCPRLCEDEMSVMRIWNLHCALARERQLTRSIEAESPNVLTTKCFAHRPADETLRASDSSFAKGMQRLDERLESRQEEVVWTSEAESRVHGIVACSLRDLGIGQVPKRVRGRTQLRCVASSRVASFVVDGACDDRHVCHFSGFEEVGDAVCESDIVDRRHECC
jgi:hypothetical protein